MKSKESFRVARTPAEAKACLESLWTIGELDWFLGSRPPGFEAWRASQEGDAFWIAPPDGTPGVRVDQELLSVLWTRLHTRLNSRVAFEGADPGSIARAGLSRKDAARHAQLLTEPLWQAAADQRGEFFLRFSRQAAVDRDCAQRIEGIAATFGTHGGHAAFLRIAEFVTHNFGTVWLCHRFQEALDRGRLTWRRVVNWRRYGAASARMLESDAPFSLDLKERVRSERDVLKAYSEDGGALRTDFFRRKGLMEEEFGGRFFGRKLGSAPQTPQQWPYFRHEIVNVVHFLKLIGFPEADAFKTTADLLNLIAPEWYADAASNLVRKRFRYARTLKGQPIPPLASRFRRQAWRIPD